MSPKTNKRGNKKLDPKFKVFPGLTPTGKVMHDRIRNRTMLGTTQVGYSLDPAIDQTRRMSKLDAGREMILNQKRMNELEDTLAENQTKLAKEKDQKRMDRIAKDAIAKYQKENEPQTKQS